MSDFISSVRANNLEGVNNCLVRGEDVNTKNERGLTALMIACARAGNSAIVSRLVEEKELDINYQDEDGRTAALVACIKPGIARDGMALLSGKTDIVRVLVKCPRVDLTIRDKEGWTLAMRTIAGEMLGGEVLGEC